MSTLPRVSIVPLQFTFLILQIGRKNFNNNVSTRIGDILSMKYQEKPD